MVIKKKKDEDEDWHDYFWDFDEEFTKINERFSRIWDEFFREFEESEKPFVYGFTAKIGPDGKPEIQEFGNVPKRLGAKDIEYREPLTDITQEEKNIFVTVELPGVEKEDIDIELTEDTLIMDVNKPERKYHKSIKLPAKVNTEISKASYKNGVLDITLEKLKITKKKGSKLKID